MGIQFPGGARPEPAKARQPRIPFQVNLPVGTLVVLRRKHLQEVITNRLVISVSFDESAGTALISHVVTFRCRKHHSSRGGAGIMVEDFPVVDDFHRDSVENLPRPENAPR
jgi:hypothetical protein